MNEQMTLTDEQREYLVRNGLPEPTAAQMALFYRASQLDGGAITKLMHAGYMKVEIAKLTGRTQRELEQAF